MDHHYHYYRSWIIILTLLISTNGQSDHSHVHGHSSLSRRSSSSFGGAQENSDSTHSFPLTDSESQGAIAEARGGESCRFPIRWEGSYFQSGVHHSITINRHTITSKGKCLEADGEKYLVYNERDSCYRCLVFHEKHVNVLQYKETFCVPERRTLRHICSTITGDANLYAMFRLDAKAIDCPFKGPYTFTYNRGHGECRHPVSSMNSCIQSSRLSFNYQACPDVPSTESTVEELQCLATWKEGSSRYLLGLIQYQHHASSYEERFRCFVYEKSKKGEGIGSVSQFHQSQSPRRSHGHFPSNNSDHIFRVAQSGDATCYGVDATLSAMEGSRTMSLYKVHQPKSCQFPSWVQLHAQWHTLDQKSSFVFESNNLRVSNSSESAQPHSMGLTMTAVCSQIVEDPTLDWVKLVIHSTAGCVNGYMCTSLHRRDGHIIEIQMGNIARRAEDACQLSYFDQSHLPYITLVSSTIETRQCPNWGRFSVTGLSKEGRKINDKCIHGGFNTLSVGCNSLDTFQFRSDDCQTPAVDFTAQDFSCHGMWEEQGVSYLIAGAKPSFSNSQSSTQHNHRHAKRFCFVFREKPGEPETEDEKSSRLHSQSQHHQQHQGIHFDDEDSLLDTNGQEDFISSSGSTQRRILEFSSFADSCRRNVILGVEGTLAFNVTRNGQCFDINSTSGKSSSTLLVCILISLSAAIHTLLISTVFSV